MGLVGLLFDVGVLTAGLVAGVLSVGLLFNTGVLRFGWFDIGFLIVGVVLRFGLLLAVLGVLYVGLLFDTGVLRFWLLLAVLGLLLALLVIIRLLLGYY